MSWISDFTDSLFSDNQVNYNDIFAQQSALYKEEANRRNKKFEANEVINANLATNTLLVGDSKPVGGSGATGNNFQLLQDEFAKLVAGTSLESTYGGKNLIGLTGDSLSAQQRANAMVVDQTNANNARILKDREKYNLADDIKSFFSL